MCRTTVPVITVFCSVLAYVSSLNDIQCNGHGVLATNSSQLCECEGPYTGDQCQLCSGGYYGDPRDGTPCYLSCTTSRLLSQFTMAGVGVTENFLQNNPPTFCLWLIAPGLSHNSTFEDLYEADQSVDINFHFSSQLENSLNCLGENVLIYEGLPSFLSFSRPNSFLNSSINASTTNHFTNNLNSSRNLVASFAGDHLKGSNLTIRGSLVTVVYVYSKLGGQESNDKHPNGFNLTVSVRESDVCENGTVSDQALNEDSNKTFGGNPTLRVSTVISSLSVLLSQQHQSNIFNCSTSNQSSNQIVATNETCTYYNSTNDCSQNNSNLISCDCDFPGNDTICQNLSNNEMDCSGRYWHSSVYDTSTDSMWLYGGLDLAGTICRGVVVVKATRVAMETNCEECVRKVGGGPTKRFLHTATHLTCPNKTSGCMLVFGGFPAPDLTSDPSDELWLYDGSTECWSRLANVPEGFASAAHCAVMVSDNTMLVIGGVRRGGLISPHVLSYDVLTDTWEVWERESLGLPGVYGHTSVYDAVTDSVYLFGGFAYSRPTADISTSLYVLDVRTRHWAKVILATEPPGTIFHSMVLINQTLVIHGGLVNSGPTPNSGYSGLCSSSNTILIDLNSGCNTDKTVLVIGSKDVAPEVWGHSVITDKDNRVFLSGGFDQAALDSISLFQIATHLSCSLAQSFEECRFLKICSSCLSSTSSFLGCYNSSESDSSMCSGDDEYLVPPANCSSIETNLICSRFTNCEACLTADIAQELGCVWCGCTTSRCTNSANDCVCDRVARNYSEVRSVCPLDFCSSPSCPDCMSDSACSWTFIRISSETIIGNQTRIIISSGATEWGCFDARINMQINEHLTDLDTTIQHCPLSCHEAKTCRDCVQASNPHGGPLTCVWSSYSQTCSSPDLSHLLCPTGLCGEIITTQEECALPCYAYLDCNSCVLDPKCAWYFRYSENRNVGICTEASTSSRNLAGLSADIEMDDLQMFYFQCPVCPNNCSGHGECVLRDLSCVCELGFIGEDCSVECECNGLSYCANETEPGRRDCLQCQQNTQGPSCDECQPFSVGYPGNGNGCVSCPTYCHGNSEVCVRNEELEEALERNITLSRAGFEPFIVSGPNGSVAVCVECEGASTGDSCDTCRSGYYSTTRSRNTVSCTECPCNGHGNCSPDTGVCSCQNNTRSIMCGNGQPCSTSLQCNLCTPRYIGAPSNNHQCYLELFINTVQNFTLPTRQSISLAVGLDYFFSNVDVQVTFVIRYGQLKIYDAINSRAVSVSVDPNTLSHVVTVDPGFELSRTKRDYSSAHISESGSIFDHPESKKQVSVNEPQSSFSEVVLHDVQDDRYSLTIPHTDDGFQSEQHYLTILATGSVGAKFFIFYRQDSSRLNYYVFFGVLISCFFLVFGVSLLTWKLYKIHKRRRDRHRARQLEEIRGSRPFAKVVVFFDRKEKKKELVELKPVMLTKQPLSEIEVVNAVPDEFVSNPSHLTPAALRSVFARPEQIELQPNKPTDTKSPTKPKTKKKPAKKIIHVNVQDLVLWPIAQQPTRGEDLSVSTVLVKLPTKSKASGAHVISTGSCLVANPRSEEGRKRKKKLALRSNRCVPVELEASTGL